MANTSPPVSQTMNLQAQNEQKGFSNRDIQAIESNRKDSGTWNVVHLLKDGAYWRAHEWSAWLIAVVIPDEMKRRHPDAEKTQLTPVKKYAKNIDGDYIFVGFQEKSFDKYLPKELQLDWVPVDNRRIDVVIELPVELGDLSHERLLQMSLDWKSSIPYSKDKKEGRSEDSGASSSWRSDTQNASGIMAIVTKVLSFPLASRTPMQAHDFIGALQQEIVKLL